MVARQTPVGNKLKNGFSTKIAFSEDPDVSFWEKTVQPPGVDGGDPIDTSDMHNTAWETFAARFLKRLTESSLTAHYDPRVYDQIVALVNVEGLITAHFPDGSSVDFYGYLRSWTPGSNTKGEPPECTINIVPTNVDTNGLETGPAFNAAPSP